MRIKPIVYSVLLASAMLFAPAFVSADSVVGGVSNSGGFLGVSGSSGFFGISIGSGTGCMGSICALGNTILYLINYVLVPVLFALAFIAFLYGIARAYIFSNGEPEEVKKGHRLVLWGIVGFVVMISLWGLVNVAASTFGLGGYGAPMLPMSY
ncbi:MAG: hypothetical protein NTU85_02145 [Candidatus Kaiserbacteria bacterium]|nr:hypothetical protein [Candidatus Kaiserbacteria bacterium]